MGFLSDKISQISYLLHGNRRSLHFDVCWLPVLRAPKIQDDVGGAQAPGLDE